MIRSIFFSSFALLQLGALYGATLEEPLPNPGSVRVIPVDRTPEPDHVSVKILFPKEGEVRTSSPVKGQIRLDGLYLGVDSEFDREKEIYNSKEGQTLHIIVDNQPYFTVNEALIDSLDNDQEYYDQTADFIIPFRLDPGMHVIRTFPARSFNECLKGSKTFAARIFYFKEEKNDSKIDLTAPYLTYNEPQGEYTFRKGQPILLDFYVSNCSLSRDGYKVRLTINHDDERILSSWQPYYIYGLTKGVHAIKLELLDQENKLVSGPFNKTERTIVLK